MTLSVLYVKDCARLRLLISADFLHHAVSASSYPVGQVMFLPRPLINLFHRKVYVVCLLFTACNLGQTPHNLWPNNQIGCAVDKRYETIGVCEVPH